MRAAYARHVDIDDVARIVATFPEVEEGERRGNLAWSVAGKGFAWERPYTKADIKRFGDQPYPAEPLVGVRTAGLAEKEALLATSSDAVFTIEHFHGYAAVLVDLAHVTEQELTEVLADGWLAMAPPRLVAEFPGVASDGG
ncbi:MmcQ/YjbR family DNA-binding protein [Nocardioides maradonensis]